MRFAIAGNPNSGKTTLFNTLTGSTAHTGNWPGVTVDRKEGLYRKLPEPVNIIDLPGIYSLSPYSPEEIIARNYIIYETPEVIINIVDASNLERNLYLTTQILEMDCPVIIALNMTDILRKNGTVIDIALLERRLGVPVVEISALRDINITRLMERAYFISGRKRKGFTPLLPFKRELEEITGLLREYPVSHPLFHAVKLLEGDRLQETEFPGLNKKISEIRLKIELDDVFEGDFEAAAADLRYRYITSRLIPELIKQSGISDAYTRSERIDKLLTHKFLGIPVFFLFMFIVFHFTFTEDLFFLAKLGILPSDTGIPSPGIWLLRLIKLFIGYIAGGTEIFLTLINAPGWVSGLILDGIFTGFGAVLSFLPQILLLFLFLSVMEDSGYMSRAAFLTDKLLRRFGLSGKSFIPLLMGFGCSVPAMTGTRILENEKERRLTLMLLPFFSCGAKLPVWVMFSASLFPGHADIAVFAVYLTGIVTAVISAFFLNRFIFNGNTISPFIMEMPAYHMPKLKNLMLRLWEKLRGFIYRASTLITVSAVIIWFLSNYNYKLQRVQANSSGSVLGMLGSFLSPLFIPLGFTDDTGGWRAVAAILTGLIAKEMIVSTMSVLYIPDPVLSDDTLSAALAAAFSPLSALSFMVFNLLTVPCMAAVSAAHSELGGGKHTFFAVLFWIISAWTVSFLIFRFGTILGFGA